MQVDIEDKGTDVLLVVGLVWGVSSASGHSHRIGHKKTCS